VSQETTSTPAWPEEQPPGEDLFLLELAIDTPHDPNWDEGASAFGSWQQVENAYAAILAVAAPLRRNLTFRLFQGSEARKQFAHNLSEELRFQRQRRNN
jgi:hypothetical protein